ncbi:MAG: EAL domain-containing protein [Zymomonas mobilis subsp. pomaceae]|uniref:putative bifunctional diguanylate cyclase/phosphodiesterase n=1 Tax=Zymomonas mobilis TaxID=542 RepID=UPI0039E94EF5
MSIRDKTLSSDINNFPRYRMVLSCKAASLLDYIQTQHDNFIKLVNGYKQNIISNKFDIRSKRILTICLMFAFISANSYFLLKNLINYSTRNNVIIFLLTVSFCSMLLFGHHRQKQKAQDVLSKNPINFLCFLAQITFVTFITIPFILYIHASQNNIFSDIIFPFMPTLIFGLFCIYHFRVSSFIIFFISQIIFLLKEFNFVSQNIYFTLEGVEFFTCNIIILAVFDYYRTSSFFAFHEKTTSHRSKEIIASITQENQQAAYCDPITGLANRRQFFVDLKAINTPCKHDGIPFSVGIIDIDSFKRTNEIYGHDIGDIILDRIGHRLCLALQQQALVYRIGNDEFGFILPGNKDRNILSQQATHIVTAITHPIRVHNNNIIISCSVGCAMSYLHTADSTQIFEHADYALYHAKRGGQGQVVVFDVGHELELREMALIEQAMEKADFEKEFFPEFQPIIDAKNHRIVAFESLARWYSPSLGFISADKFISIAEQTGTITRLTPLLFEKTLKEAKKWPTSIRVCFNLSALDISTEKQIDRLIDLLTQSGIAPERIEFELTETAVMHNFTAAFMNVKKLQKTGVSIALDDFGTSYSSLSHIQSFPMNKLKIDRSFVTDLHYNNKNYKIIKSIITLCQEMNLECVVEGVECEEEVFLLSNMGIHFMQGYYYSRPMSSENVINYISKYENLDTID